MPDFFSNKLRRGRRLRLFTSVAAITVERFSDESAKDFPVRGFLHRPDAMNRNGLVLTHGAGANCEAPLLVAIADAFAAAGWLVLRCDLPFRQRQPHGPPRRGDAAKDQQGLRQAVKLLRALVPGRVLLGGQSYGGRQASMAVAGDRSLADGLLLLSYPLHPPNRPAEARTTHFGQLFTPVLFVHGTRDTFASPAELQGATALIPAPKTLLSVAGAGHSLLTRQNRVELPQSLVRTATAFFSAAHLHVGQ